MARHLEDDRRVLDAVGCALEEPLELGATVGVDAGEGRREVGRRVHPAEERELRPTHELVGHRAVLGTLDTLRDAYDAAAAAPRAPPPGADAASAADPLGADAGGADYLRVDLHPLLLPDERTALHAIAGQLGVLAPVQASRLGSFCDGLRFVLHLLRRSQPGRRANGGGRREGQARPVVFILHDFELFAQRPKQVLLYSLFDLLQTEDAQMAVVGLTTRVDAADLLEKRVRSRFSQRLLLVPPLVTTDDCAALIRHTLALPAI